MGAVFWLLVASLLAASAERASAAPQINQNTNQTVVSDAGAIALIYPDVSEPYRSVFAQIVGAINEKIKDRVFSFAVGTNVNTGELNNALRRQKTRVAIALGRQGIMVASALDKNIDIVAGGISAMPNCDTRNMQVNILSPDPALMFTRLKEMMPKMRRVFVVYDPRQNAWIIRQAKEAARAQGMQLEAYEAQDLRSAMRAYQDIFAAADPRHDALWLPQDSISAEEGTVLPLVLQESWARNLAMFSSSYGHVKRGALFSMYPDNAELGRRLAISALEALASGGAEASGMTPLRAVQIAVNLRTAKHVGADTERGQDFDMTFPEQ